MSPISKQEKIRGSGENYCILGIQNLKQVRVELLFKKNQ